MATITHGWGLIEDGREEEGLIDVQQGLAAYRATREELGSSLYLILLAETYGITGNFVEGGKAFSEAEQFIRSTDERFWEAELYRLSGELSCRMGERETGGREELKNKRAGEGASGQGGGKEKQVTPSSLHPFLSRSLLPQGHPSCPAPAGQIARTACNDELGTSVATTGETVRSSPGVV